MRNRLSHSRASQMAGELFGRVLNRNADKAGYAYVLDCLESGTKSLKQLTVEMMLSEEYLDRFTDLGGAQQTVNRLNQILLGHAIADAAALRQAALRYTRMGLTQYVEDILRSAAYKTHEARDFSLPVSGLIR